MHFAQNAHEFSHLNIGQTRAKLNVDLTRIFQTKAYSVNKVI